MSFWMLTLLLSYPHTARVFFNAAPCLKWTIKQKRVTNMELSSTPVLEGNQLAAFTCDNHQVCTSCSVDRTKPAILVWAQAMPALTTAMSCIRFLAVPDDFQFLKPLGPGTYRHYGFHKHHKPAKAETMLLKLYDYPPTTYSPMGWSWCQQLIPRATTPALLPVSVLGVTLVCSANYRCLNLPQLPLASHCRHSTAKAAVRRGM